MLDSLKKDKRCLRCSSFFEVGTKKGGKLTDVDVKTVLYSGDEKFLTTTSICPPNPKTVTNRIAFFSTESRPTFILDC